MCTAEAILDSLLHLSTMGPSSRQWDPGSTGAESSVPEHQHTRLQGNVQFALRRDADDTFIQRVGVIKVEERVSFADAFALALAERLNVPLVTTDHHEFDAVERKGRFRFLWLR